MTRVTSINGERTINTKCIWSSYMKEDAYRCIPAARDQYLPWNKPQAKLSDSEIQAIVSTTLGSIINNIVNNYTNADTNYWEGILEEEDLGLAQELFDLGQIDNAASADRRSWLDERGVTPELLDAEVHMEKDEEDLEIQREKYTRWNWRIKNGKADTDEKKRFHDWVKDMKEKKYDLDKVHAKWDTIEEDNEVGPLPTAGAAMSSYLEFYIEKMSLGEMALALDVIEQLKPNKSADIREANLPGPKTERLSWFYYSKCALVLSYRLNKVAPTWQDKYGKDQGGCWNRAASKAWANWTKYHDGKTFSPSFEDRFYGEVSFNMDDAIDRKRKAERMAKKNNVSVEEMWYILCEQEEDLGQDIGLEKCNKNYC